MKDSVSKKQLRDFGLLVGFGVPIIIGWIIPAIGGHVFRSWTLWFCIPFSTIGVFKPRLLLYPYKGWMAIGHALGWLNSRIILGLIFFIVLQPIAFIMKFFGYDPLRKKSINKKTYRESKENYKIDLTRIF
tara:strand:+ start:169 stop:561 length:393 start_codon:yes stop_codon:yes gene_type:complete